MLFFSLLGIDQLSFSESTEVPITNHFLNAKRISKYGCCLFYQLQFSQTECVPSVMLYVFYVLNYPLKAGSFTSIATNKL